MAQSRLIELSYFDPHTSIRLTTYADTIVTDYSSPNRIISAVRFGGYPEVVKAMSDAIYGGATIDVCSMKACCKKEWKNNKNAGKSSAQWTKTNCRSLGLPLDYQEE